MDPFSLAVTGLGIASRASDASRANKAARSQANATRTAQARQSQQEVDRAAEERRQRVAQAQQIIGRIRAGAAGSGTSFETLSQAGANQAVFDSLLAGEIINRNTRAVLASISSQADANIAAINARTVSPIAAGISAVGPGISTGIALSKSIKTLTEGI